VKHDGSFLSEAELEASVFSSERLSQFLLVELISHVLLDSVFSANSTKLSNWLGLLRSHSQ
jgi:hypothetical protein